MNNKLSKCFPRWLQNDFKAVHLSLNWISKSQIGFLISKTRFSKLSAGQRGLFCKKNRLTNRKFIIFIRHRTVIWIHRNINRSITKLFVMSSLFNYYIIYSKWFDKPDNCYAKNLIHSYVAKNSGFCKNCVCVFSLLFASNAAFDHQFRRREEYLQYMK